MIRAVGSDFAPSKNCRIVIADDHPIVLIALSHFLNSHGFTVDAMVSTADETCAAILNPDVQLVITDYVFGHPGDGLHLVDRLRRLRSDIGILVYSMVTSAPVINDILLAGANAFVAGSAVFKGGTLEAYKTNIAAIRHAAAEARGEAI